MRTQDADRASMEPSIEGRRVLVTGGAGGLGAAISRELAADGALVVVADLRLEAAEAVAAELPRGLGHAVELDVADDSSVARAVRAVVDERPQADGQRLAQRVGHEFGAAVAPDRDGAVGRPQIDPDKHESPPRSL